MADGGWRMTDGELRIGVMADVPRRIRLVRYP
jgi:hypothetical protein